MTHSILINLFLLKMNYLNIKILKKHLNVDDFFHDDDQYISQLGDVAEQMVEADLDANLTDIVNDNDGKLPSPILHAMMLLVGNFYQNREGVAFASASEIPQSYEYLLSRWHNYKVSET